MKTEPEIRMLKLLEGGRALSPEHRLAVIERLSGEDRAALERIAAGEVAADDPRFQRKALSALGMMRERSPRYRALLRSLITSPDPKLQVRAIQHLAREPEDVLPQLRELVRSTSSHPGGALAAARILAANPGPETVEDLLALRRRFLALVPNERSPSILVLDQLLRQARGEAPRRPDSGRRPIA